MLVLGIDTATRAGSAGLVRVEPQDASARDFRPLAEHGIDSSLRHGETLLGLIDACLEKAGVGLSQVEGFVVSIGPGSFTGLRVALATAKGLALASGAWLVGVSTLEAFAATVVARDRAVSTPIEPGDLVCVCLDARKGEVYSALFELAPGERGEPELRRVLADSAGSPAELATALAAAPGGRRIYFLGDGLERYGDEIAALLGARARAVAMSEMTPRGSVVAALGAEIFRHQGAADLDRLAPVYLRVSEAERKRRENIARIEKGA